jgi:hypothetical protein
MMHPSVANKRVTRKTVDAWLERNSPYRRTHQWGRGKGVCQKALDPFKTFRYECRTWREVLSVLIYEFEDHGWEIK